MQKIFGDTFLQPSDQRECDYTIRTRTHTCNERKRYEQQCLNACALYSRKIVDAYIFANFMLLVEISENHFVFAQ